jgi:hypothetical protein
MEAWVVKAFMIAYFLFPSLTLVVITGEVA